MLDEIIVQPLDGLNPAETQRKDIVIPIDGSIKPILHKPGIIRHPLPPKPNFIQPAIISAEPANHVEGLSNDARPELTDGSMSLDSLQSECAKTANLHSPTSKTHSPEIPDSPRSSPTQHPERLRANYSPILPSTEDRHASLVSSSLERNEANDAASPTSNLRAPARLSWYNCASCGKSMFKPDTTQLIKQSVW